MGTAVARRLLAAGYEVSGYDPDEAKRSAASALGVKPRSSVAEVATSCPIAVLCVFDTAQVLAVVEGPGGYVETAPRGEPRTVICTSTCDPAALAGLALRVAPTHVRFVEAPVSGTSKQLERGEAVFLIGGDEAAVQECRPVLDAICPTSHYLGAAGNGGRAKLAINLILGLNRAAMAEGLVLAERLGLDPARFLEVAKHSAAYSQAMDIKGPAMVKRAYEPPQSRIDQSLKDFTLMASCAARADQPLPFAEVYIRLLRAAMERGNGGLDNAAILEEIRALKP
jgi:3-hydroxyisobutyrate dehydrogenase-like beta-hydroxyacid dehydrogenase